MVSELGKSGQEKYRKFIKNERLSRVYLRDCFLLLYLAAAIGHYQTVQPPPLTPLKPHIIPPPKIFPHPPSLTQKYASYTPTHPHPPKIMSHPPKIAHTTQNNASLTVTHTKYGPITHIYSKFSLSTR